LYDYRDPPRAQLRDELPEKVSERIDTEKSLILILWSVSSLHSLADIPEGTTCHSVFCCDAVIVNLLGTFDHIPAKYLSMTIRMTHECLPNILT
jgi:hypothetical protein